MDLEEKIPYLLGEGKLVKKNCNFCTSLSTDQNARSSTNQNNSNAPGSQRQINSWPLIPNSIQI